MGKEPAAAAAQGEGKSAGAPALLRERFNLLADKPLPELNTPSAQAFVAEDRRDSARQLYTLVTRPTLPARMAAARSLRGVQAAGLQSLVEWGTVPWQPAGRYCFAAVYDRPVGGRVMVGLTDEFQRYDEVELIRKAVTPLVAAIRECNTRGVTHRAIRPTNLFYMTGERDGLAVGDCVTTPPGYDQPAIFEPIESAMCHPAGRGAGRLAEDMYALGVTLVILLLGRNPVAQIEDDAVLAYKITIGSYATLVGDERLPVPLIEMLRGLLCDDAEERWDLDALSLWLDGRRLNPLQPRVEKRANRPFAFNDREYLNCRELAIAFAQDWEAGMPAVVDGRLELWLRRSVEDKDRAQNVATAVREATTSMGDRRVLMDVMMARVCIALDPAAPIRYKGFSAMPEGFGPALALLYSEQGDVRLFAEILMRGIPSQWLAARDSYTIENAGLDARFGDLRDHLQQTGLGGGIERCLYDLNDGLPCLSPLVADDYVWEIKGLLAALDAAAARRGDHKAWPIDRHIAAFVACRAGNDISRLVPTLNGATPERTALAMLNVLARMQWRLGPEEVHGLASWMGGLMGPVIAGYHSRDRRRVMEREIPRLVRKGSLTDLARLLDDPDERQKDGEEFTWAQREYAAAMQEVSEMERADDRRDEIAARIGRQAAAMISVVVALLTMSLLVIIRV